LLNFDLALFIEQVEASCRERHLRPIRSKAALTVSMISAFRSSSMLPIIWALTGTNDGDRRWFYSFCILIFHLTRLLRIVLG
jgi:hypothetical protein